MGKWVTCMGCLNPFDITDPNAFASEEGRKEFSISGLCQNCQNDRFGGRDYGDENDSPNQEK